MSPLGSGDILVHCGDFTRHGDLPETRDFARFMAKQDYTHKMVIAGNHDWCFENTFREEATACLHNHGIIYLNDSGAEIDGIKFWGSPVQPEFFEWAFTRKPGKAIRHHWDMIPGDTDVLITHGPAHGILDKCNNGFAAGCADLLKAIQRIKPGIHACGHIHEAYGVLESDGTVFINACILDECYRVRNPPIKMELRVDNAHNFMKISA